MTKISERLERSIRLVQEDTEFLMTEKAAIADALYGIDVAKEYVENDISELLDAAVAVVMRYMYHLQIFQGIELKANKLA